jgi:hypothetical protein
MRLMHRTIPRVIDSCDNYQTLNNIVTFLRFLYFEPKSVECIHFRIQGFGTHPTVQGRREAGRVLEGPFSQSF